MNPNERTPLLKKLDWDGRDIRLVFDCSALMYRAAYGGVKDLQASGFTDWSYFKFHVINYIVDMKSKFGGNVKEVIVALDKKDENKHYWRNQILPDYKLQRKMQASLIPKDVLHKQFDELESEIIEHLPWKVIEVPGVEADDIVGMMCERFASDMVVIFCRDKDYSQLQSNKNIRVFNISTGEVTTCPDPRFFKFDHIIRGDSVDNIPSIYKDKTASGRAKPIRESMVKAMYKVLIEKGPDEFKRQYLVDKRHEQNFITNRKLIDLTMLPPEIKEKITLAYDSYVVKGNQKTAWEYFTRRGMRQLTEKVHLV